VLGLALINYTNHMRSCDRLQQ